MKQEIWKDVIGYEGLYQVSNLGRIKALKKCVIQTNRSYIMKEKIIKQNILYSGYYYVNLYKNNKVNRVLVHRVVSQAFIPNTDNKPQVNHKDGNKLNNCVDNLEWVSASENNYHAIKTGLRNYNSMSYKICQIKNGIIIATFDSIHDANRKTNISVGNIDSVIKGNRKTAGGFEWKLA